MEWHEHEQLGCALSVTHCTPSCSPAYLPACMCTHVRVCMYVPTYVCIYACCLCLQRMHVPMRAHAMSQYLSACAAGLVPRAPGRAVMHRHTHWHAQRIVSRNAQAHAPAPTAHGQQECAGACTQPAHGSMHACTGTHSAWTAGMRRRAHTHTHTHTHTLNWRMAPCTPDNTSAGTPGPSMACKRI